MFILITKNIIKSLIIFIIFFVGLFLFKPSTKEYISSMTINNLIGTISYVSDEVLSLEIPTIDLNEKVTENQDIDKGIVIHESSIMPNEENSILILSSHSGDSNYAYFNNIIGLNLNDIVKIYYNDTKYVYELYEKEIINKNGYLNISRVSDNKVLYLITCLGNNNQIILKFNLISS